MRWLAVLPLSLLACGSPQGTGGDGGLADGGAADTATGGDAGSGADATIGTDAGAGGDAGSGTDAATSTDAGTPTIWHPAPGTSWQWQLTGTLDTSVDVAMYDVDLVETTAMQIQTLHDAGRRVVCYLSAGTYEPGRPDSADFPAAVLGSVLPDWPDERWLDVRDPRVAALMNARLDVAASKHCDGVEPDNVDGWANDSGFPLTAADELTYLRALIAAGHARGLSVGLKNDLDQVADLVDDADWALDEECFQYDECDMLTPFIDAHKAVFEVEYETMPSAFCSDANARNFDSLYKHLELDAYRVACR